MDSLSRLDPRVREMAKFDGSRRRPARASMHERERCLHAMAFVPSEAQAAISSAHAFARSAT